MRRPGHGLRAVFLSVSVLLCAAPILADTIVLKNGRRIVALYAVEEGDKVRYETSAGQLTRSEEHTSELQSRPHLVCRLLLEKKKRRTLTRISLRHNT